MSEYKTLKEWFGKATRGDGRKFTRMDWLENQWIEPIYLDVHEDDWHGLNQDGYSKSLTEEFFHFKEWHPPKKKVTKYLWYNSINSSTSGYMAENSAQLSLLLGRETNKFIRLDWSATEFDDE